MSKPLVFAGLFSALILVASCRPQERQPLPAAGQADPLAVLDAWASQTPAWTGSRAPSAGAVPPVPPAVEQALRDFRLAGTQDHLPYLVEYGLRVHLEMLRQTRLARELPVAENPALGDLVRLAAIPAYTTAHEAGWLNRQFYGPFHQTGWSSYQIYLWAKEAGGVLLDFPNSERLAEVLRRIDASGLGGVGGGGGCHYDCQ
jgi:hypothetical protein